MVTDKEFESLPPRIQDQVRRHAAAALNNGAWTGYFTPAQAPNRYRRVGKSYVQLCEVVLMSHSDWLRDKVYFEKLLKRDSYAKSRLGFTAPNIFVMVLVS